MRDLNEDSNSSSWPHFYGDKTLTSGQYFNGYVQRTVTDACPGYDKDTLKQKMLEHEAIFKNQVYELHRLYQIQRDMMEDIRRKEIHKRQMSIEPSSSSSLLGSQMPSEDAGKWHMPAFPLANSVYPRPSMSGAEIVSSPLSCTKGNNAHTGRVNGSTSKDCEILEVRPSKVRKKLFDLQLPADEYIDTEEGEQLHDDKASNIPSPLPNGCNKVTGENHEKFFHNGTIEKFDYQRDASASESYFRRSIKVADLNEPVEIEDGILPSSVDFCVNSSNCGETNGLNLSAKPSSDFLGLQKEIMQNANCGSQTGARSTTSVGNKGNERDWLIGYHESDHRKNKLISLSQGHPQDHQSAQVNFNKAHQPPATLPNNYGRDDPWRDRTGHCVETLDRIHGKCNNNNLESVMTAQIPSPYPFNSSSDFANSWSHSALSWAKPTSSMTEKPSSFHAYPSLYSCTTMSKSSHASAQSHGILGEKWQSNGSSRLNPIISDLPVMNGFYQGSSSGSKDMLPRYPTLSFGRLNCNGIDNAVPGCTLNHRPEDFLKSSNIDVKPVKDMDLNVVHSKSSSIEALSRQDVENISETCEPENRLPALPWLRSKPVSKSEATNARNETELDGFGFFRPPSNQIFQESEHVKDLNKKFTQKVVLPSSDRDNGAKETSESKGIKKLLGFPIFEKPSISKNESSLPASTSVSICYPQSGEKLGTERRRRLIDINLACDEERDLEVLTVEKVVDTKVSHIKNHIDLNSCVTEDEEPFTTSVASNSGSAKVVMDIDLEAPVQEIEDDVPPREEHMQQEVSLRSPGPCEQGQDEVARVAAEAIILLSSSFQHAGTEENTSQSSEDPLAETLLWFAHVLTSSDTHETKGFKELKGTDGLAIGNYSSDEMDDFEVMTLQLQETKEEDYMPKPFVPEVQNMEESGANSVTNRPRKGQTRRGRQRRDFQRDILPGLASLSRHEVTEDLQTFGGLMRATGHPWNSGLTRRNGTRNGGARGRRRIVVETASTPAASAPCTPLMQQLNNIEAGLEDRSLTGWGKTTRRPRRQRCPAGNPPTVPLT